ncbi:MAG TPA: hypothetical protein VII22_26045 [Streptosporangiaceae bacterium]
MTRGARLARLTCALLGSGALVLGMAGCKLIAARSSSSVQIHNRTEAASVLVVLLDRDSSSALATFGSMLRLTAQPNEHIIVIEADTGRAVGSFTTPKGPAMTVPAPPSPLPANPTAFEAARYRQALARYQVLVNHIQAELNLRQREQLASSADAAASVATLARDSGPQPDSEEVGFMRGVSAAIADISSLEQSRITFSARKVLAIVGFDGVPTASVPSLPIGLQGLTIVLTDFPSNSGEQTSWQAGLLRLGATRAVLLTSPTSDELPMIVRQGLNGGTGQRS